MESPILPTPPTGTPYIIEFLVGLLSLCLIVAGYLYRDHSKYRDKREADDKAYREQQLAEQKLHWKEESEARNRFRSAFEQNTTERFEQLERDARDYNGQLRAIIDAQQAQIHALGKELDRLTWELGLKKPPKEGV